MLAEAQRSPQALVLCCRGPVGPRAGTALLSEVGSALSPPVRAVTSGAVFVGPVEADSLPGFLL